MVKTPEQWLEETTPQKKQAIFKLFFGYAPGVGKTFNMLSEGIRRHSRGEDVVIGIVETHGRAGIAELASKLETVPRRKLDYKGATFEEMDLDALLERKPQIVLVDELGHSNIEGSKHPKRYQDVMDLLDAQIDVLSTMNVQHIESLMPTVMNITGIQVRETVPDWVMQRVNEIVAVISTQWTELKGRSGTSFSRAISSRFANLRCNKSPLRSTEVWSLIWKRKVRERTSHCASALQSASVRAVRHSTW
jgi:two-component system sensor histidine kinase KdpD